MLITRGIGVDKTFFFTHLKSNHPEDCCLFDDIVIAIPHFSCVLGDVIVKKTNSSLVFTFSYAPGALMLAVKLTLTTGISQLTFSIIILCVTAVCFVYGAEF